MLDASTRHALIEQLQHSDGDALQTLEFPYARSADQDAQQPMRHPVVIVGAGPVGLSLAIDLAQRGQPVVVLDNDKRLSAGSRAICFAKRTLEIWGRLGMAERAVQKGVAWKVGKVFEGAATEPVYQFDLLPEPGHEYPAFINLQQYYAEAFLVERALQLPLIDIRWQHKVDDVRQHTAHAELDISTPDGLYTLQAQWLVACDGSRSTVRRTLGLEAQGQTFRDRFLIADVRLNLPFPCERWFWFNPPFHPGQSVLLHMQPDGVWRIDFQLGWDADPDTEKQPERIIPRIQAMLGPDVKIELVWASVYTFACQRMEHFVHGPVIFAGDSAHGVSPFGARGANSGVQDADNLAWKLNAVLRSQAPTSLIDSYGAEREYAADENILNSTRSTDFITPKSSISHLFRSAVLQLAQHHGFARRMVNSGRLSMPAVLHGSSLHTAGDTATPSAAPLGSVVPDAPIRCATTQRASYLLRELGADFTLLCQGPAPQWAPQLAAKHPLRIISIGHDWLDPEGLAAARLGLQAGGACLVRPDQHLCARWAQPDAVLVQAAMASALGHTANALAQAT
ncbi:MAG: FAD-dependent oxidoreductase [Comamonas sp.]